MAGPPLGTQLGAMGINIAAFVKDFNLRTSVFREGVPLPTRTTVNADRSYNLTIHHPTSVYFLKQVKKIYGGMNLTLMLTGSWCSKRCSISWQRSHRLHHQTTSLRDRKDQIRGPAFANGGPARDMQTAHRHSS